MFALARLVVVGFIVLTIVYVCLSLYSRSVRKGKLKAEWIEQHGEGDYDDDPNYEAFIDQGLQDYDGSLRRKLILGVYIIPVVLMITMIYLMNFS
ncbi:hypothetical protein [Shimia sediminis]|uniref:hypothetical protein n=1 Tax=Shimia sediminis TaxID=2497945 RepID=UPI000F8F1673|nr:hypothetical protein [Shimia sediminis]